MQRECLDQRLDSRLHTAKRSNQRQLLKPDYPENPSQGIFSEWRRFANSLFAAIAAVLHRTYSELIPIVRSHLSTKSGHSVIGNPVRRSPNA
jgi:hypothetical protein